jgi:glycerophosphoryl diester phosphodiesterase
MSSRTVALLGCCVAAGMIALNALTRADPAAPAGAPRRVEFVAHRGESHDAPENTLAAIRLAWERGVDAVELDVHLTADRELVVIHDADTERVTGGRAKLVVAQHAAAELRKLDVGAWKGARCAGEHIPTLGEVLATLPRDPDKRLLIEVKVGPEATEPLAAAIEAAGRPRGQTAVISFNLETCRSVKKRLPAVKVYYLASFKRDDATGEVKPAVRDLVRDATDAKLDGLDVSYKGPVDAAFAKRVREAGLELHVWTVDHPADARRMVEAGVDGITTNRAAWMREQVGPHN